MKGFKRKDPDGKVEYMQNQKRRREAISGHPSSVPYDFSDLTGTQERVNTSEDIEDITTAWIPFRRWFIDEKILNPSLEEKDALVTFKALLTCGQHRTRFVNNQ